MPLFTDLDRLKAELDALRPLAPEQEARGLQKFRLEWNSETQGTFYDKLICFWLDSLHKQTYPIDNLFAEVSYSFHLRPLLPAPQSWWDKPPLNNKHANFHEFKAALKDTLGQLELGLMNVAFAKEWQFLRQPGNTLTVQAGHSFHFGLTDFSVSEGVRPVGGDGSSYSHFGWNVFTSPYLTDYDLARLPEINYQLANKVYDFIAAKLAEADTPTA